MSEFLRSIAPDLAFDPAGYWVASGPAGVSYPEGGHDAFFEFEDTSFWFRHRNRVIREMLARFPPAAPLIDVGGGNGCVAKYLEDLGMTCVLVEPGRVGAMNARRRGIETVVCSTFANAGFRAQSLDAVGLFDVLEHVEDAAGFLRLIHTALRPGGHVHLTVPAFPALWSTDDIYAGHHRRYTRRSLRSALEGAGFSVQWVSCFFWFLPAPVLLFRSLPSRLGFRKTTPWEKQEQDHPAGEGVIGGLLDLALAPELRWLRAGRSLPMGGSCFAVARRPDAS